LVKFTVLQRNYPVKKTTKKRGSLQVREGEQGGGQGNETSDGVKKRGGPCRWGQSGMACANSKTKGEAQGILGGGMKGERVWGDDFH